MAPHHDGKYNADLAKADNMADALNCESDQNQCVADDTDNT